MSSSFTYISSGENKKFIYIKWWSLFPAFKTLVTTRCSTLSFVGNQFICLNLIWCFGLSFEQKRIYLCNHYKMKSLQSDTVFFLSSTLSYSYLMRIQTILFLLICAGNIALSHSIDMQASSTDRKSSYYCNNILLVSIFCCYFKIAKYEKFVKYLPYCTQHHRAITTSTYIKKFWRIFLFFLELLWN